MTIKKCIISAVAVAGAVLISAGPAAAQGFFPGPNLFNEENPQQLECPENTVRTFEEVRDGGGPNTFNVFQCVETTTFTLVQQEGGTNPSPFPGFPEFQNNPAECVSETTVDCTFVRRFAGCFAPETKILMADGSEKMAVELVEGDLVWNPVTKKAVEISKRVIGPEKLALIEVGYDENLIQVTQDHPMIVQKTTANVAMNSTAGDKDIIVKRADELTPSDYILASDGKFRKVNTLRKLEVKSNQLVVNFTVSSDSNNPSDHMIVANGIVTGDLEVQTSQKAAGAI